MPVLAILRWTLAAACIYHVVATMTAALKISGIAAAAYLLIAFGALFAGVLLISPETVTRFCGYCSRILTGIIFPDAQYDKPKLSYILARTYSKQMRYSEAFEQYKKIIHYYPREKTAYIELIELLERAGENKLCIRYRRRFKRLFHQDP
jgi:tetratricopeptide (TPR) repeat protein